MVVNAKKLTGAAEAILFSYGEPMELIKLAEALEIDEDQAEQVLYNLSAKLDETDSGICLLKLENKYQLSTRTEYADLIRNVLEIKRNAPLSQAAFEVLAVVAYNQPITKSYIEQVRGVDCSGVIATLSQKKLIEEKGRLDLPGKPLVYGTTPEFLRCFSLTSLDDLPELPQNESNMKIENEADGAEIIKEEPVETE